MHNCQSIFTKDHSCITALANVIEHIRCELDDNKITFLTLLDDSKAFDALDLNILCMELNKFYTFPTDAVDLIKSYLSDRCQAVSARDEISQLIPVLKAVL